jgi:hypothetical protein
MKFKIEFELFDGTCDECPCCGFAPMSNDLQCNAAFPYRWIQLNTLRPDWCPLVEVKDEH